MRKGSNRNRDMRAPDGKGTTLQCEFDEDDPIEQRALRVSQELATKRGRRKQYLVEIFSALYEYKLRTGKLPSISKIVRHLEDMSS